MLEASKKFPEFVDPFPPIDEKQKIWINLRSFGNLTIPSQVLVDNVVKWGKWFDHFHGDTISKHENPIEQLCYLIEWRQNFSNAIDVYIVNLFVKIRFFNRIKILNNKKPLVLIIILSIFSAFLSATFSDLLQIRTTL